MALATDRLGEYLAQEEPLVSVSAGTLYVDSAGEAVSIGLTDRRVICVSGDEGFLSVGYDSICSIRRRQRTSRTVRGNDSRLLLGVGFLLSVLGIAGVILLAGSVPDALVTIVAVGGAVSAGYLRRSTGARAGTVIERTEEFLTRSAAGAYLGGTGTGLLSIGLVGIGLLASLGLLGAVLFVSSIPLFLSGLVTLGGVGLMDYGHRHLEELDGIELVRRREAELVISTDDGRTVRIRSDPSEGLGRQLNRLAYADGEPVLVHACRPARGSDA